MKPKYNYQHTPENQKEIDEYYNKRINLQHMQKAFRQARIRTEMQRTKMERKNSLTGR